MIKPLKWHVLPVKTQTSLRINSVRSVSSPSAQSCEANQSCEAKASFMQTAKTDQPEHKHGHIRSEVIKNSNALAFVTLCLIG